jgi:hypothetical protein
MTAGSNGTKRTTTWNTARRRAQAKRGAGSEWHEHHENGPEREITGMSEKIVATSIIEKDGETVQCVWIEETVFDLKVLHDSYGQKWV